MVVIVTGVVMVICLVIVTCLVKVTCLVMVTYVEVIILIVLKPLGIFDRVKRNLLKVCDFSD